MPVERDLRAVLGNQRIEIAVRPLTKIVLGQHPRAELPAVRQVAHPLGKVMVTPVAGVYLPTVVHSSPVPSAFSVSATGRRPLSLLVSSP